MLVVLVALYMLLGIMYTQNNLVLHWDQGWREAVLDAWMGLMGVLFWPLWAMMYNEFL